MGEKLDAFIDESGNPGHGRGRFFTIAIVLCPTSFSKHLRRKMKSAAKVIKEAHPSKNWKNGEVKAAEISNEERGQVLSEVCQPRVEVYDIVIDKSHIQEKMFDDKSISYNYWLKLILDKVVDVHPKMEELNLYIDRRTIRVKSANSFHDYISIHFMYERGLFSLSLNVSYPESHKDYGIQCADFVSNAINHCYLINDKRFMAPILPCLHHYEHFPYYNFAQD